MGGALIGFLRGWVMVSFLTFLTFLLPMPDAYYTSFSDSFFGPAMAKTVPLMFEKTALVHPANPSFMRQMEDEYGSLFKAMIAKANKAKKEKRSAGGPYHPWL